MIRSIFYHLLFDTGSKVKQDKHECNLLKDTWYNLSINWSSYHRPLRGLCLL